MSTLLETLRGMGVTETPMLLDAPGEPFAAFLLFAAGRSPEANKLLNQFLDANQLKEPQGKSPQEIKEFSAKYIDWLIVNHWGKAE